MHQCEGNTSITGRRRRILMSWCYHRARCFEMSAVAAAVLCRSDHIVDRRAGGSTSAALCCCWVAGNLSNRAARSRLIRLLCESVLSTATQLPHEDCTLLRTWATNSICRAAIFTQRLCNGTNYSSLATCMLVYVGYYGILLYTSQSTTVWLKGLPVAELWQNMASFCCFLY